MKSKQSSPPAPVKQSEVWSAWEDEAQSLLVQEMKSRGIGYKDLSARLERLGVQESPDRLNRKVNRKKFSAAFLLACIEAIKNNE